jgi:alkyl hydroperoxide reductase subunit AhpC
MVKFYWSPEPLQFGDQIQFRIASRTYDHLVYAVDIQVEQTAKEIRFRVSGDREIRVGRRTDVVEEKQGEKKRGRV